MPPAPRPASSSPQPCNWDIRELPGLSADDQAQLAAVGITTTKQLLHQGRTPAQRSQLAAKLQIHVQHVNKWVALADLARVPSVGCRYCGLLLHAGIGSTSALATASLHRLHPQLRRFQVAQTQRPDLCPPPDQIALWIQQARSLCSPPALRHKSP